MLTEVSRRQDFPGLSDIHYLNTAAESIPPLCVGEALQAYWRDKQLGMQGREPHFATWVACQEIAAQSIGLANDEVAFCSCSSEAYNLLGSALQLQAADEVVINDLDFPAGATPWLTQHPQPNIRLWSSRSGRLDLEDLRPLLSARTRLVQTSLISFFNGFRLDWPAFISTVRERAPDAIVAVDITQALGRVPIALPGADILISSTHKWSLGIHGGCIIGIPKASAARLTTSAGGWYHLSNAFDDDRFTTAKIKTGAASFSVGMPNFAAIYALNAALRYLQAIGQERIAAQADPLVAHLDGHLRERGLTPLAPYSPNLPTGIVAFRHPRSTEIHGALLSAGVHIMHHAGRLRVAIHGYNTADDINHLLDVLRRFN